MRFQFPVAAIVAAISVSAVAGCTSNLSRNDLPTGVGDAKPMAAVAVAARMPIQGIDVSRHVGEIDWRAVKRAGIAFAYLKTTEGGDHADPMFFRHWEDAREAGIYRGAYHFMYWCRPADEQALFFMVNVPNDPDALPPVLDLEWNNESRTCPGRHSAEKVLPMIRTLLTAMQARTGKRPIIYTDITFYREILKGTSLTDYPMWLRSTAARPQDLYGPQAFVYWQFTGTGRVPGIRGDVDRNVFNGSAGDWARWLVDVGATPAARADVVGALRPAG